MFMAANYEKEKRNRIKNTKNIGDVLPYRGRASIELLTSTTRIRTPTDQRYI